MSKWSGGRPRPPGAPWHSVFGKLIAIMLTMALSLIVIVTFFFGWLVVPVVNRSMDTVVDDYVRRLAASDLTYEDAMRMKKQFDVNVRYEGPRGQWTTAQWLPPIDQVTLDHSRWLIGGSGYHIAAAPDGGRYLFHWDFRRRTISAHHILFTLLILLMGGAIISAHLVIRRLLRPLRTLGDGVAQLSAGDLDVVLPPPTRDEFGALTEGFNEMVGRIRERIRARDQLLLDVSHELRSPLTRMRVAVELLPEGVDRAGMIAEIAEMESMIGELLELERLRDGRAIRTSRQNLAAIVRDVIAGFPARPPGVRIVSLPPEIPVDIDAEKMRTVLRNLLDNAIKYSLPDSRAVEVSAACDGDRAVLRVTDDGLGIPPEDRAGIFEPFFRVDRSRSKARPGYGLGLSICKRIAEAHGGTIEVRDGRGRGSVFEITLPAA
jgi:signal transduction histidine kinase